MKLAVENFLFLNVEVKCGSESCDLRTHRDKVFNYGKSFIINRGTDFVSLRTWERVDELVAYPSATSVINPITSDPCFIGSN
jgi:hypothetical protein